MPKPSFWVLGGIGVASGFMSALFGVGGGIVVVPLLVLLAGFDSRVATGTSLVEETVATRESFLQTARLVDRDAELEGLLEMLAAAKTRRGASLLVGGESGVPSGKPARSMTPPC